MKSKGQSAAPNKLLIVCEGETEVAYFKEIVRCLGLAARVTVRKALGTSPQDLLHSAYSDLAWSQTETRKGRAQIYPDEAWIVCDRDSHANYGKTLEAAARLNPPVGVCWTNPCFEFWYWLHFCRDLSRIGRTELQKAEFAYEDEDGTDITVTVHRSQRRLDAASVQKALRECVSGYKKGHLPAGIVSRTATALDNLSAVSQSSNAFNVGSAVPQLLRRLFEMQKGAGSGLPFSQKLSLAKQRLIGVSAVQDPKTPLTAREVRALVEICAKACRRISEQLKTMHIEGDDLELLKIDCRKLHKQQGDHALKVHALKALEALRVLSEKVPVGSVPLKELAMVRKHFEVLKASVAGMAEGLATESVAEGLTPQVIGQTLGAEMLAELRFIANFVSDWEPSGGKLTLDASAFQRMQKSLPKLFLATAPGATQAELVKAVGGLALLSPMMSDGFNYPLAYEKRVKALAAGVRSAVLACAKAASVAPGMAKVNAEVAEKKAPVVYLFVSDPDGQ